MTIRELRQALTEIDNQNLTVRELRAILFEQEEQDRDFTKTTFSNLLMANKVPKRPARGVHRGTASRC